MIIKVNKEARSERFYNAVNDVVNELIEASQRGDRLVTHPPVRGEDYKSRDLIRAVEEKTEGSVRGWIGDKTLTIHFVIKE